MLNVMQGGDGSPPEPDWSGTYADELDLTFASEQWRAIVREMTTAGTLAVANGHAIKRLVEFRVQYERAARHVAENGAITPAKRTGVPTWNLYWSVMTKADEAIRVLEAELGISPVRRSKATKVQRGKKAPAAADAYLKPVARG